MLGGYGKSQRCNQDPRKCLKWRFFLAVINGKSSNSANDGFKHLYLLLLEQPQSFITVALRVFFLIGYINVLHFLTLYVYTIKTNNENCFGSSLLDCLESSIKIKDFF